MNVCSKNTAYDNLYIFEVCNNIPFAWDGKFIDGIEDWCRKNYSESDGKTCWRRNRSVFYLSGGEAATLFKLTWC